MFGRDRHDTYRDLIVIMLCIPGAQVVIRSIHGGRIAGTDKSVGNDYSTIMQPHALGVSIC